MLPKPFKLTRINTNKTVSLITSVCIDLIFPFRSYLASSILTFSWDKTHSHMCVRLQGYSKFFSYYSLELAMLRSLIQCMVGWVRREMGSGWAVKHIDLKPLSSRCFVKQEALLHFVFLNSCEQMGARDIPLALTLQRTIIPSRGEKH